MGEPEHPFYVYMVWLTMWFYITIT